MRCSIYWQYHENVARSKCGENKNKTQDFLRAFRDHHCWYPSNLNTRSFPTQDPQIFLSPKSVAKLKTSRICLPKKKKKNLPSPQPLKFKWHTGDVFHRQLSIQCQFQSYQISPFRFPVQKWGNLSHTLCVIVTVLFSSESWISVVLLTNFWCIFEDVCVGSKN